MFSFLKKSSTHPYTDKVWKKTDYAIKGMLMMAMLRLQNSKSCLLISFFDLETERLKEFMNSHKLEYIFLDDTITNDSLTHSLYLMQASYLDKTSVRNFIKDNANSFSNEAFFSGHYPLSSVENRALQNLRDCGLGKIVFCISFDDPLLKIFNSHNILPLLEKLGLEEEEAIEHNLVTQSIKRAREKVEAKVKYETKAKSLEEWFAANLKK